MTALQNNTSGSNNPNEQAILELNKLMARSATDPEFRKQLLAAPHATLSEFYGRTIPSTLDIRFVENTADATFVLPDAIDPAAEMSEQDLEAVAGGSLLSALSIIASAIEVSVGVRTLGDPKAWLS